MRKQMAIMGKEITSDGSKGRPGGGGIGQKIGAVAGGVIGGMVGSAGGPLAGAQGAMMGAGAGAGLGGLIGETVSPATQGQNAMQRRAEAMQPQIRHSEQSEQLKQSLVSLKQAPPDIQQEYAPHLARAYVTSVAKDNPRSGGMA